MSDEWRVETNDSDYVGIGRAIGSEIEWFGRGFTPTSVDAIYKAAQAECDKRNKEIEDKKFDIAKYVFDDRDISEIEVNGGGNLNLRITHYRDIVFMRKADSIAIARHFYDRAEDKEAFINKIKGET